VWINWNPKPFCKIYEGIVNASKTCTHLHQKRFVFVQFLTKKYSNSPSKLEKKLNMEALLVSFFLILATIHTLRQYKIINSPI